MANSPRESQLKLPLYWSELKRTPAEKLPGGDFPATASRKVYIPISHWDRNTFVDVEEALIEMFKGTDTRVLRRTMVIVEEPKFIASRIGMWKYTMERNEKGKRLYRLMTDEECAAETERLEVGLDGLKTLFDTGQLSLQEYQRKKEKPTKWLREIQQRK